jgi:hypothetical protein
MHNKLICNLYAFLCWQNFIFFVKSGCFKTEPRTDFSFHSNGRGRAVTSMVVQILFGLQ